MPAFILYCPSLSSFPQPNAAGSARPTNPMMPNQLSRRTGLMAVLSCSALVAALLLPAAGVRAASPDGTPVEALDTLPGFKIDLVARAEKADGVSWISLAKDNKGRLLIGGQN